MKNMRVEGCRCATDVKKKEVEGGGSLWTVSGKARDGVLATSWGQGAMRAGVLLRKEKSGDFPHC